MMVLSFVNGSVFARGFLDAGDRCRLRALPPNRDLGGVRPAGVFKVAHFHGGQFSG